MREKILKYIENNARIDIGELAVMLGESEEMIVQELHHMEEERIICGYHTMINWDLTEVQKVNALIEVRVTPKRDRGFDYVAQYIYNYPEVNSVYLMSGNYDFMVTLEGKTLQEVSEFVTQKLSTIEDVLSTRTNFILKKYKDHNTVMQSEHKDERLKVWL